MSTHDNDVAHAHLRTEISRLEHVRDAISATRGEVGARRRHEDLTSRIAYLNGVLGSR